MAASLTPEQLRVVDASRTKLDQLTKSIEAVMRAVALGNPMPDLSSVMAHAAILTQTTTSITSHLSTHSDLLSTLVAYPSPQFPGRQHEGLAGVLLRKKMEPDVESWVEEGRIIGKGTQGGDNAGGSQGIEVKLDDEWKFAAAYTVRETKRIVETSMKEAQRMEDESSDEEDEDGDTDMDGDLVAGSAAIGEMGGAGIGRSVQELARFANTGVGG